MSTTISGDELFGKGESDNLNRKTLKKLKKKKKDLDSVIDSNLPFLVEYYFESFFKGKEREKHERDLVELLGDEDLFIKPLRRLLKENKKKKKDKKGDKSKFPKGLHVLLLDNLENVRNMNRKKLDRLKGGGRLSDDSRAMLDEMREDATELAEDVLDICTILTKKMVKKLVEFGMAEHFAIRLAHTWVPAKYLNTKNIRRYIMRTNQAMYAIQREGVVRDDKSNDENRFINKVGVNLSDSDTIKEIYEILYEGIDRKVMISALVGIMLERRGKFLEGFTIPQKSCFTSITKLIMELLEGHEVINFEGKKAKDKDLEISKKELNKFMEEFAEERIEDMKKGRDGNRRVTFSSFAEDSYPRVLKAFRKVTKDAFENFDEQRQNMNQNNANNRQNNNNGKNNQNYKNNRRDRIDRDDDDDEDDDD